EDFPWIKKTLKALIPKLDMFKGAVMDDPVIRARTEGIGVLTKQDVHDYAAVGPTARASGVAIDVRKDDPCGAYDKVEWKLITQEGGDVFAKAVVRILEMYESVNIILQCLDKMPKGPIDLNIKDMPVGEGIGRYEAPRGEVFHYIMSDGGNSPARHKVRAPSFMNIASNKKAVIGHTISDATIILAAVDPCYCCTERMAVVDYKSGKKLMDGQDLIRLSQEKTAKMLK
ncbi:MAG: NADH:ubiquinone oxidoreductase, partial [Candidatus Omnitrophica bacterium]|nr:NADH:ubiquinone oxidoreductase [Candidatus Omnitrophota bacterium]